MENKRRQHHRQRQQGKRRQYIAVAQLVKDAAIRVVSVGGKKIGQPARVMPVMMRMASGFGNGKMYRRTVPASAMNQPVHQAQHRREQKRQGQIDPYRSPCHAP